jgi:adenosyl cobinamide kinase/adenosyl cobinamide phosphate guanylyltransferase
MNNQFFYTRKVALPKKSEEQEEKEWKTLTDSFAIDKVIRTMELEDGKRIVLLDDVHERLENSPQLNAKGKVTGFVKQRNTVQSEIQLEKEDSERFVKLLS